MELDEARRITRELVKNESAALDALAREELGLNPDDLGSPWGAATFSFVAFAAGAALPLLPFLLGWGGERTVLVSAGLAGIALFAVGATLSLFTGRNALRGGLRMVLIGGGAGAVTWLIGRMLGAAIA
jgi:VIT1/CCC1 family predicted Fe2+/Mn2+ transporter